MCIVSITGRLRVRAGVLPFGRISMNSV